MCARSCHPHFCVGVLASVFLPRYVEQVRNSRCLCNDHIVQFDPLSVACHCSFNSMLRIWKIYDFPCVLCPLGVRRVVCPYSQRVGRYSLVESPNSIVPSRRTLFSSYPGTINSGDDFYLCSYGLAVMETTIGTYNMSSLSLITPSSVLEWQRVMVASRLATSGGQWASLFATENSGTYNNQVGYLRHCRRVGLIRS